MRRRLAVTAAAVTAMVVLAFSIPLGFLVRWVAESQAVDGARLEARSLAAALAGAADPAVQRAVVERTAAGSPRRVTVYPSSGPPLGRPQAVDGSVDLARTGKSFTASRPDGGRDAFVGIVTASGEPLVVRVSVPRAQLHRGVARSWIVIALLGATLTAAAVAVADRLGRNLVGSIGELGGLARRLHDGELDARCEPSGPPEVRAVTAVVNELAGRIEELIAAERESAADVSHRLRTPLTAIRLHAERLADESERNLLTADVLALQRSVDEVIAATRTRPLPGAERADTDLCAVVRSRAAFWTVLAEHQGRPVEIAADGMFTIPCRVDDAEAAVDALVANVFAHTPEGCGFAVRVVVEPGGGGRLEVEDDGPGWRGAPSPERGRSSGEGSSGLGLDIVRQCAAKSGGDLALRTAPSGGALVVVRFGS